MKKLLVPILFVLSFLPCMGQQDNDIFYLYLLGDGGEPDVSKVAYKEVLQSLKKQHEGTTSAVVFLGDNVYPKGMEDEESTHRLAGEKILKDQIELVGLGGSIFFIPGNHDWKRGRMDGLSQLLNQQAWIDSLKNPAIQFLPREGCPGPVEIALTGKLVLVIMDSQWWLHPWEKPEGENSLCEQKSPQEVMGALEDILQRNRGKQVVIAAHHPVYTYGQHGGVFTLKDHLFPLTNAVKDLYFPLPGIGSIYPVYRKVFGSAQDVASPLYKTYSQGLAALLKQYPGAIHVSGHEHALQYIMKDSVHYLVSGSAAKSTPVKKKGYAQFVKSEVGFVRIALQASGNARIDYFGGNDPNPVFVRQVEIKPTPVLINAPPIPAASEVTVKASERYKANRARKRWMGANYRDVWGTEIKVPVFDFKEGDQVLRVVQQGGGQQTLSLRLEDSQGKQYTLRSVEKYPEKAIPKAFRGTFAQDVVQDQISAAHPYGALIIPPLAAAAGIYHTNPKLVWLADDPRLGVYRKASANRLMMFEERPEGDARDKAFFGNAEDIVSTFKVIDKLAKDNDHQVDERFVLRSRLFDLWIGDWDRHDDQWRWAEFDKKKGNLYRPIPRDRDQAFFVNEGKIPKVFSRKWALPKLQGFDENLKEVPGFMFNGRYFDRSFLTSLQREDWIKEVNELKAVLTDEVIEEAVRQWPEEIYKLHGEEIVRKLKVRRGKLETFALAYYRFLAEAVNVVGSDKHELFKITYLDHGDIGVKVFKTTKDGEVKDELYERKFLKQETNEIRLYGLGGKDQFEFFGPSTKGIKVRVIGGKGEDRIENKTGAKPLVYDKPGGIEIAEGSKINDKRSDNPQVNTYDRKEFKYNLLAPLVIFNYNVDDGLFLGGGFFKTQHGFRKSPFKARHFFLGSYAPNTGSFNLKYVGHFTHIIGRWSGEVDADIKSPNFVNNFFGLGNESVFDKNVNENPALNIDKAISFYRLRFREWLLDLRLSRKIGGKGFFKAGPSLQFVELERNNSEGRFVQDFEAASSEPILEVFRKFAGAGYSWGIDNRNTPVFTTRGIFFEQTSRWMGELGSNTGNNSFTSHTASISLYQSFRFPARVTFASRVAGGISTGDYQIYQAQILDGKTELRGFRKTRFYGDSKLFFNNEVRIKLGDLRSYLLPGAIGITFFYDVGRVWYENDAGIDPTAPTGTSTVWHNGYGAGIWLAPFNMAVISTELAHSVEGTLFNFRLGFLF